jgi:hypothetical protein
MSVREFRDDELSRRGAGSWAPSGDAVREHGDHHPNSTMTKFIQLCASQNDLFALDEGGRVYQYDFCMKTWVRLAIDRSHERRN